MTNLEHILEKGECLVELFAPSVEGVDYVVLGAKDPLVKKYFSPV